MDQKKSQRPSGFTCPVCNGFIPVSIMQLIEYSELLCPQCLTHIRINREDSSQAIEALKKVQRAEDGVKKASVFRK